MTAGSPTIGGFPVMVMAASVGLAAVHLVWWRFRRTLPMVPRSRLLSLAGGASVAYVFVHVLPEVASARRTIEQGGPSFVAAPDQNAYLLALGGFLTFYGLEQFAKHPEPVGETGTAAGADGSAREVDSTPGESDTASTTGPTDRIAADPDDRPAATGSGGHPSAGVFWVHVGSFALYNGLIGYLLVHREMSGPAALLLFAVAMGLHLVVNDHGLLDRHRELYCRRGRWVLAATVLGGTAVGLLTPVGESTIDILFAFLAGSVVLNSIKEELPDDRESQFWAFALGAAGYSVLLLLA